LLALPDPRGQLERPALLVLLALLAPRGQLARRDHRASRVLPVRTERMVQTARKGLLA